MLEYFMLNDQIKIPWVRSESKAEKNMFNEMTGTSYPDAIQCRQTLPPPDLTASGSEARGK